MYRIIEQTDAEKMTMYMKSSKKELISMLIECNKVIDKFTPIINTEKSSNSGCDLFFPNYASTAFECVNCGQPKENHYDN